MYSEGWYAIKERKQAKSNPSFEADLSSLAAIYKAFLRYGSQAVYSAYCYLSDHLSMYWTGSWLNFGNLAGTSAFYLTWSLLRKKSVRILIICTVVYQLIKLFYSSEITWKSRCSFTDSDLLKQKFSRSDL